MISTCSITNFLNESFDSISDIALMLIIIDNAIKTHAIVHPHLLAVILPLEVFLLISNESCLLMTDNTLVNRTVKKKLYN